MRIPLWPDLTLFGVPFREGVGNALRCRDWDKGRYGGGVASNCMARTEEELRNGERVMSVV